METNDNENTTVLEKVADTSSRITVEANPEFIALAVEKLDAEIKSFKGGDKEKTVSSFVALTLTKFCNDNARFAEVVYKTTRTLSDICREILDGTGIHVSDFEVYRSAVQSYFPNAEIHCYMTINITGAPPDEGELRRAPKTQAPVKPTYTPRNPSAVTTSVPVNEPEYFETIQLEL